MRLFRAAVLNPLVMNEAKGSMKEEREVGWGYHDEWQTFGVAM